jgi:CheY-like chemotaxis protein
MNDKSENKLPDNLKVLVAEDNEISKLLVTSVLQNWGFVSSVANNGNEAIACLLENDYDLILMDIQMPEKDGIEATIDIRNLFDERKRKIPIIALTANGVKGEEKKYFEAGMNGFLTKPFKENDLYELIQKVMYEYNTGQQAEVEVAATKSISTKQYSLALIEDLMQGNKDLIKKIVETFISSVPPVVKAMENASLAKDWLQAAKEAHSLKSNVDTLKMNVVHGYVKTIEINGKNSINTHEIPLLVEKAKKGINEVIQQLKEEFGL